MKFGSLTILASLISLILLTNMVFAVSDYNVGVSPGTIDLGLVESGTTKAVDFYIITSSNNTMTVYLEPESVILKNVKSIDTFSEEEVISWIKVTENPVVLEAENSTLESGGISSNRQVSFLLEIPEDSEPGNHAAKIKPIPVISSEDAGTVGSMVVALTSINLLFNVEGEAERNGKILDVETGDYGKDYAEIKTYFQNTGTVTISASGTQKIYDNDGNLVSEIVLGRLYIKPKEIVTFKGIFKLTEDFLDEYGVYTTIDYTTGQAEKSSTIQIAPKTPLKIEREDNYMLIVAIILILIVSIIIYGRVK